jgi:hypothetical protein
MPESDYFPFCQYTKQPSRRVLHTRPDGIIMLAVVREDGLTMHAHIADADEKEELAHTLRGGLAVTTLPTISVRKRTAPTASTNYTPAIRTRRKP